MYSGCDADFGADLGCSSKYVVLCSELGIAFLRMGVVIDNYRKLHIYLMGQIQDLTELKYIWLAILTGNHAGIISCLVKYNDDLIVWCDLSEFFCLTVLNSRGVETKNS